MTTKILVAWAATLALLLFLGWMSWRARRDPFTNDKLPPDRPRFKLPPDDTAGE